jgi:hypothetical protein
MKGIEGTLENALRILKTIGRIFQHVARCLNWLCDDEKSKKKLPVKGKQGKPLGKCLTN